MKQPVLFLLFCLIVSSLTVQAQNRRLRDANKEYDIHAYNLAIQSYREVLQRDPNNVEALTKIADSYRHLNMMDEAARYYDQALRQRDVNKQALLEYGHVLRALSRYDEAKQYYLYYARDVNNMVGNHYAQSCDFAKQQLAASSGYSVTSELINTPSSEFGPHFAGRDQVVFSSARTDTGVPFDGTSGNNLFVSTIGANNMLAVPYLLRNGYRAEGNEGPVAYSPDGTQVAFTRNNFVDGTRHIPSSGMQLTLFTASVNPNGEWVDARPFPFNVSGYSAGYASYSPDGRALYFASDRPDGFGGYDIYVSQRVGTAWSTPENLGPVVNSPGNEITPSFDGNSLYFASDWHHGLGGFDVFRAEQTNGRWAEIFHLGAVVNSQRDDYGFVTDNTHNLGYVVSNRTGGMGNEDIYRVTRAADNITLVVRNASDGSPLAGAIVDFIDCGEGTYQTNAQGIYSFQAVQGLNCNLVVRKDGYVSASVPLSTTGTGQQREVVVNLSRISETYPGKVVDYSTRLPLSDVTVAITNRTTRGTMQAATDYNGDYYVALSPYTTYDVRMTRQGYQDLTYTVQVEDGLNRNLLGVVSMLPTNVPNPNPNPTTPTNPNPQQPTVSAGYAVQVAALTKPSVEQFSNLANLGNVYAANEGGRYKIRVGVYPSRADAEQALTQAKSRGYSGAFIVQEEGVKGGGTPTTPTNPTNPPTTGTSPFKVQLAAYRNPQYFDASRVSGLGPIERMPKGDLTVMMIGNINSLQQARNVRQQARAAGFPGAFILQQQSNGQLVKVE